ncbi:transcriptional regulator with XRE-family HTH domain [Arthrobacter bambusae]|nr:transcriptional regulator with XRE-family HTH domain [Arthrobacter bambusae]MDQ0096445.1 transcriptional regulator with XRE-family HTH domain [Arthrobacter bambusae]
MKGLRRSEAAMLAGVSVDYYAKLELGTIAGASASVLDALSDALQLDETERAHLLVEEHQRGTSGLSNPDARPVPHLDTAVEARLRTP